MKRIGILFVATLLALCSCQSDSDAGTLTLKATAPALDDDGASCGARILVPATTPTVWVHFLWSGPASGRDSVQVARGALATITRTVRAGTYAVNCFASNAGGAGCDTSATFVVVAKPATPTIVP